MPPAHRNSSTALERDQARPMRCHGRAAGATNPQCAGLGVAPIAQVCARYGGACLASFEGARLCSRSSSRPTSGRRSGRTRGSGEASVAGWTSTASLSVPSWLPRPELRAYKVQQEGLQQPRETFTERQSPAVATCVLRSSSDSRLRTPECGLYPQVSRRRARRICRPVDIRSTSCQERASAKSERTLFPKRACSARAC